MTSRDVCVTLSLSTAPVFPSVVQYMNVGVDVAQRPNVFVLF